MGKGDDLVKFVTERVVQYIDTPKEVRKEARVGRNRAKEQWQYRWFGMIPFALRMWSRSFFRRKDKHHRKKSSRT